MFDLLHLGNFIRAIRLYGVWQVGIELLLIGIFVYSVIRFLRGTRGARMLKGVGVLLVVLYLIVRLLGTTMKLERIEFLYGRFLVFASVALVVVFQPEIRRALMRLGETRLFKPLSSEINKDIESLVEAATFLSRRKIGAVVAIEREVGFGGIAETGTRIDAELSAALLDTIFWPNSPLHDLGVIVSGGRLLYAGVQFPLAEGEDFERELGSRHRAAVGMSQETDAVVLVVSEETGDISVAEAGRLIRRLTPDNLRSVLTELLTRQSGSEPHVKPLQAAAL
ncbi:MAG: diadenylate cyclase CdaA [Tepidisphaeraceae bacterium]|jgi:diadenylate cyclase